MARSRLVALSVVAVAGCSSMLGYDDVGFTPPVDQDAAAGGGAGVEGGTPEGAAGSGIGGTAQGGAGGSNGGSSGATGTGGTQTTGGAAGTAGTGGTSAGGTGGGASGAGGGAGCVAAASNPVSCSTPLADRIKRTQVATQPAGGSFFMLSPQPSGCSKAAWASGSDIHVTPLDGNDQRFADDAVVSGAEVRGLVAHDDGSAILVQRSDEMVLVRLAANGVPTFQQIIVGNNAHTTEGDKWIDSWPHQGRLAWSGTEYATYFGHTGNWGAQGNHQGDFYGMYTTGGTQSGGGWGWGCSHSLDVRITHNGQRFGPVCLADCYPGKGIYFDHNTLISNEPSGNCAGGSDAALGGLVGVADGFWFTYASKEGRPSSDIGMVHIDNNGTVGTVVWLTDTAADQESNAHLAHYGANLIAAWNAGSGVTLTVFDLTGKVVEGPVTLPDSLSGEEDFVNFPNGDVGWINPGSLSIVRIPTCS